MAKNTKCWQDFIQPTYLQLRRKGVLTCLCILYLPKNTKNIGYQVDFALLTNPKMYGNTNLALQ